MKIWVDADACPVAAKEILFRAAERTGVLVTLVANQPLSTPYSEHIKTLQVPRGFDVADDEIVRRAVAGDLVITSDIPLAAELIEKGAMALSPRGERFTAENIGAKLNMRDFLDTMRSSGVEMGGGQAAYGQRDKQDFANQLDRLLAQAAD
ncbi:MAG: YaiI/YqxD family protein [Pseudomonadota bacterium]